MTSYTSEPQGYFISLVQVQSHILNKANKGGNIHLPQPHESFSFCVMRQAYPGECVSRSLRRERVSTSPKVSDCRFRIGRTVDHKCRE